MSGSFLSAVARLFQPRAASATLDLGAGAMSTAGQPKAPDLSQIQGLIGKVTELTTTVVQDVGSHNATIQAISTELTAVAQSDPNAVAAIVCKLLVANQELQGRLERAEETLQHHSYQLQDAIASSRTDSLTGLMNRRALDEELRRCLTDCRNEGKPAALLMLDVDRFKSFNDSYGHPAGDQALIHVAQVLRDQSRGTDIVARFGGEEFAVVFTAATAAAVRERAERLRTAIGERTVSYEGRELCVTASAGLSDVCADDSVTQWLKRSDRALYAAKNDGRNCAFELRGEQFERLAPVALAAPAQQVPAVPATPVATEPVQKLAEAPRAEPEAPRTVTDSSVELAAEAFNDTTFVPSIARRIAEWRRGGATLTVVLARLDDCVATTDDDESSRAPIRTALQLSRLCLREMDVITRWQANGLAFLLPSTSAADAKSVARRLRTALANDNGGSRVPLSLCIGIAEGIEGNDAKRVLERAWFALDAARSAGPGQIYFHDGLKSVALKLVAAAR